MPVINQQSSILSEQELQLLASHSNEKQNATFKVYSYQCHITLRDCKLQLSHSIEQLIVMLRASPRGVAVLLPDTIESNPSLDKLVYLLTRRADIRVFWLGALPSMETNLPVFVHCKDEPNLRHNVARWQNYITRTFTEWLARYSVAFITENEHNRTKHQKDLTSIGLQHVDYFDSHTALHSITDQQLLIVDLDIFGLRLVDILKGLSTYDRYPIIIIFGELPENVCRATYTLIKNSGFPVLASLTSIPDDIQWNKLLSSLFSKVYLKHWVSEEQTKVGAYPIVNLETQIVESYFCLHGMSKEQIAILPKPDTMRHVIQAKSLQDWFPERVTREMRVELGEGLKCGTYHIDICVEYPEKIQSTSIFFSALVMARLSGAKIYWLIENERSLLTDMLNNLPISDAILSEAFSHQLLTEPSDELLNFLKHAQAQQVNIVATLQPNRSTNEVLALYGITSVLNKQSYIE